MPYELNIGVSVGNSELKLNHNDRFQAQLGVKLVRKYLSLGSIVIPTVE
jgi:hypothetical protein